MLRILSLLLIFAPAAVLMLEAQTLDVRTDVVTELRPGDHARHGEVVLGKTTLAGARRMFAELLHADTVKVSRGHLGNPSPLPLGTVWEVEGYQVRPTQKLDLGPSRYTLYFDKNERLIAAITRPTAGELTRDQVAAHHPSLRQGRRWYSGDQPHSDEWTATLDTCVAFVAMALIPSARVEQLSYIYTCPTQMPGRATPPG